MIRIKIADPALFRANITQQINQRLGDEKKSKNIEISAFNYTIQQCNQRKIAKKWDSAIFIQIYLYKLKAIMLNLTSSIIDRILTNDIEASSVAFLSHQQLSPEKWANAMDKKQKQDNQKFEVHIEATTDTYTCRKCRSNKCSHYLMQTRSADEPMTCFITCVSCGNKWKE